MSSRSCALPRRQRPWRDRAGEASRNAPALETVGRRRSGSSAARPLRGDESWAQFGAGAGNDVEREGIGVGADGELAGVGEPGPRRQIGGAEADRDAQGSIVNNPAQTASTLAAIGSDAKDALPTLLENLLDKDVQVQMCSFQATLAVGQGNRGALSDGLKVANARGRWAATVPIDKNTVPNLIKKLAEKDTNIRVAAVRPWGGSAWTPSLPLVRLRACSRTRMKINRCKCRPTGSRTARSEERRGLSQEASFGAQAMAARGQGAAVEVRGRQGQNFQGHPEGYPGARRRTSRSSPATASACDHWEAKAERGGPQSPPASLSAAARAAHIGYSIMPDQSPEPDWVRDQINDTCVEAVPALLRESTCASCPAPALSDRRGCWQTS